MSAGTLSPVRWRLNALFFGLTVLTTFAAGSTQYPEFISEVVIRTGIDPAWIFLFPISLYAALSPLEWGEIFAHGLPYAGTLLSILIFHEFGHYILARRHRVDTTLPFFIPMPLFFIGTMGAVIKMRSAIRSRDALLDIGAAGPLAGLLIAIPALVLGMMHSEVQPLSSMYLYEGNSLFFSGLKWLIYGPMEPGTEVVLHPVASAAWVGLFMTALNLLPIGQLDGGHIAFALFLRRHARLSQLFHGALLLSGPVFYLLGVGGANWVVFGVLIGVLMRDFGPRHPPVDDPEARLSPGRLAVGILCLLFLVLLFPPVPLRGVES